MLTFRQINIKNRLFFCLQTLAFTLILNAKNVSPWNYNWPKYEVRAVWLTTLSGLDWPKTYATNELSIKKQKAEMIKILDKLKDANINTVLFQTRIRSTVIYPSSIEPWDACMSGTFNKFPGYDPLAFVVEECHKRGMELHAWIVSIPAGKWDSNGCKILRRKHPSLIVRKGQEGFLDPANPATAIYLSSICSEITQRYDIDGIHLDYIRYPETWQASKQTENQYIKNKQKKHITNIVKTIHDNVKRLKPWVKLSCATIGKYSDLIRQTSNGWNAFDKGCQDVHEWMRNGLVDQIYPMMYFRGNNFYPFLFDWAENSYGCTIVPGLGIYFLSPDEGEWPLEDIKRQMNVSRSIGMGYAIFRENFFTKNVKGIYDYTKELFTPIPSLIHPIKNTAPQPNTPVNLSITESKNKITLTWDCKNNTEERNTFNIYASSTHPVNIDNAQNILAVRLSNTTITLDKNRNNLHFAVTSVNRYGIESAPIQCKHNDASQKLIQSQFNLLENNGKTLKLPSKVSVLDAEYVLLKNLIGTVISIYPYKTSIDIRNIPSGHYAIYSLDSKGRTHKLGFTFISHKNSNVIPY